MTESEYKALTEKRDALWADLSVKDRIADQVRSEWCALHHLLQTEDQRREIIAEMKKNGEIP